MVSPVSGPSDSAQQSQLRSLLLHEQQIDHVVEYALLQKRRLAATSSQAQGAIVEELETSDVVLKSDFENVVGSTSKTNEVDIIRDSDGKMRLYADSGAGLAVTEVEIDFGSDPVWSASFTIVDAAVTSSAKKIIVTPSGNTPTGGNDDDWEWDGMVFAAKAGTGSFTLRAIAFPGPVSGKRKVYYTIN